MEEAETVSVLSRKELRKQKLMEYLAAKGKLKQPNPRPYLRDDCQVKKPVTSALKVMGKENSAPTIKASFKHNKVPTLAAQSATHPARRVFGASSVVNVKSSSLNQRQNTSNPSAKSGSVQSKLNPVCSNTNLNTASHFQRKANTGIRSSERACSNAAGTAVTKLNTRVITSSKATWSCPIKAVSVRMSLGPVVKTKTGLIPAVIQPRNIQNQNSPHTSATATNTTTNTISLVSVSKRSGLAHRITLPSTALNIPMTKRTTVLSTARADIKVQDQSKSNSKPLLSKHGGPSCKGQLPSGLKSTSSSFKSTAPSMKPKGKEGTLKTNKPVVQPTDMSTKLRSESQREKNIQQSHVASRTSSGPPSSRVVSGVTRAAVIELGAKNKKCYETCSKKGLGSANVPPPQTDRKKSGAPMMSDTMPRLARTIGHTGQTTDMKTKKVPVRVFPNTESKKMTAAQEERMRKLQEWREAKGISYKRPPMQVKPQVRHTVAVPQPFWAAMKEEDDAHSLICAVDRSLVDCIKLLAEGCPPDQVKEVLSRLPAVSQKFAKYWICKARLMEQEGNLNVLPMFEEAVRVVLEPVDDLRTVVFEILKKKDEFQVSVENEREEEQTPAGENTPESINNPMMTPKPVRALICGERGDSSVVKYKITATPGCPQSQQKEPARVNGHEVRFFTPVRRSVRIERASLRYPASLQDHDLCVASYNDMMSKENEESSEEQKGGETSPSANETPMYIYRQNEALKDKVFIQLICDEGV